MATVYGDRNSVNTDGAEPYHIANMLLFRKRLRSIIRKKLSVEGMSSCCSSLLVAI